MSDSNPASQHRADGDNKLVDFIAAVATALALCLSFFLFLRPSPMRFVSSTEFFEMTSTLVGGFALAAAAVLPWRHPVRARWGWAAIAALGVVFMYMANVAWDKVTGVDTCACGEADFSAAQQVVVLAVLWLLPTLLFMGVFHYLGLLIGRKKRKPAQRSAA
jgi:hypothetical protein